MKNKVIISPATWFIILISIVIGGYLYWFYTNFEKTFSQRDIGPIKEVTANPFYAAERFLEKVGKTATTQKNFSILNTELDAQDTLIIESSRVGLTKNKREKIKLWLESGGHLILLATEIYDDDLATSRDVFLDEIGIRLYDNPERDWSEDQDDYLTKVTFEDSNSETSIEFNDRYYLQDASGDSTFIGGNNNADFFAQYALGEGILTVVTDLSIWKNWAVGEHDHAMFLYQLIGSGENIWFLYNTVQPSLLSIMLELIPMLIISFIALVMVMLYSAAWRKGPPISDDVRIQRELMQHIEAAGEFSYRNDFGITLIKDLMSSLENRLRRSIHQYSQLSNLKKSDKLSQLTGIKKQELEILWQPSEHTQENFVAKVLLIQKIRKLI